MPLSPPCVQDSGDGEFFLWGGAMRADLQRLLADHLPPGCLHLGYKFEGKVCGRCWAISSSVGQVQKRYSPSRTCKQHFPPSGMRIPCVLHALLVMRDPV